jgi:hypothetical protein
MLRILPVLLTLIATVGGWFTVPATAIETGRDSSSISWIAKNRSNQVRVRNAGWDRPGHVRIVNTRSRKASSGHSQQQASAFLFPASSPVYVRQISHFKFPELFSRPVDCPPAFRLGQRPPPQSA